MLRGPPPGIVYGRPRTYPVSQITSGIDAISHKIENGEGVCRKDARDLLRDTAPDASRRVGRVCERVVGEVISASVSSSAFCAASAAICLISSSSVFGATDLRLRDLARRVDGGGGEAAGFEEDVVLVGVAGSGNVRGWWRVETIVSAWVGSLKFNLVERSMLLILGERL